MSRTLICWPRPCYQPTVRLGPRLREVLHRMRLWQLPQVGQVGTECFGRLTDKDEMVVKGLAVRAAHWTERGEGRG
jgi:hypothetical protein